MSDLRIVPITQKTARAWVDAVHRHLSAPRGDLYRTSLVIDNELVAVGIAGRPCRMLDDGLTVEITRLASIAAKDANASSRLYSRLVRAGRSLGYKRFITYTLEEESGSSCIASSFHFAGMTSGGEWSRPSRLRREAEQAGNKKRWVIPSLQTGVWPDEWSE